ncbi:hypothetical protein QBC42DRAFT_280771 [Cladorrhinum samala]|uniref:Uncharacterized protein n=1 Tax=Cladorrhinum samala TaxID=585594 RepID=A0AAV9H8Q4_9PEZI|nr:hypothetical protein QBC42DRAFT_280771 [Cladorrhinum samala]
MNGLYDTATFNLHREVLLSLRFILGGTRLSRRLARKSLLLSPAEGGDSAFGHLFAGRLDHLLTASTNGNMSRQVAQQDFLTPWGEFPLLCNRLLEIQEYNKGQRPTKTRAQIRDLRNPAQWCTLWAVMIIGCAGLFLSALQLGIGVAQLKYAIKPNSDPPQTTPAAAASSTTGLGAPNS